MGSADENETEFLFLFVFFWVFFGGVFILPFGVRTDGVWRIDAHGKDGTGKVEEVEEVAASARNADDFFQVGTANLADKEKERRLEVK